MNARLQARKYENLKRCGSSVGLAQTPPLNETPVEIQLELTTHCNLQCTMCPRTLFETKRMHMSRDVLHKAYELFPDAVRLIPFGLGEPLLYPYFWELIETAKRHDVPVCFNTNGTVLTPQRARRLVDLDVGLRHTAAAKAVLAMCDGRPARSDQPGVSWTTRAVGQRLTPCGASLGP